MRYPDQPLPPSVRPIEWEPLRFYVTSRTNARHPHLVELSAFGGIGCCSCQHFQMTLLSKIKAEARAGQSPLERHCWHLKQAWTFYRLKTMMFARDTMNGVRRQPQRGMTT